MIVFTLDPHPEAYGLEEGQTAEALAAARNIAGILRLWMDRRWPGVRAQVHVARMDEPEEEVYEERDRHADTAAETVILEQLDTHEIWVYEWLAENMPHAFEGPLCKADLQQACGALLTEEG